MKVLLIGSTQIHNIGSLLRKNGIETMELPGVGEPQWKFKRILAGIKPIKECEVVYRVFSGGFSWVLLTGKFLGKRNVSHWIGTDVLYSKEHKHSLRLYFERKLIDVNLCGSPLLQSELSELGIQSVQIPILPTKTFSSDSLMPNHHSVLTYIPDGREKFYGMQYIEKLALKHSEIEFRIVANSHDSLHLPNVLFCGRLSPDEMNQIYDQTTVLFRFPEHDGLSMMLLEALSKGKYVIYPYKFPHTFTPKSRSIEDVQACFDEVVKLKPAVNHEASEYIRRTYSEDSVTRLYRELFQTMFHHERGNI